MKQIVIFLLGFTLIAPVAKAVVTLPVVEDTYIQANNAGPNGSSATLLTKDGSGSYLRNALLKFSLVGTSSLPVERAYIEIFITDIQSNTTTRKIDAHIIDSTWDEATVKWNDAPAKGDLVGSLTVAPPVAGKWVQLDMTDYFKDNWNSLRLSPEISFSVFQNNGGLAKNYIIASKEYEDLGADPVVNAGDKAAKLTIAFSNPSSLTFDGVDDYVDAVVNVSGNGLDSAFTLEASIYAPSGANNTSTSKGRHGIFGTDYTDAWASPYLGVSDEDEIHYGFRKR